ncbi:MAG: hypothetical protein ACKOU7_12260 [Ferruginibacter sp.]
MKTGNMFLNKKIAAVGLAYFLISAFLLFKLGIQLDGEAEKFIDNANRIISGQGLFNGVFGYFYIVYTLLVALFIKLSVNLVLVGILQIGLSFFAALCLYKLLVNTLANTKLAFLFFIIYLLCYPIQKWNFFLYSESVHTSLLVIGMYCYHNWSINKKRSSLAVSLLILILIFFSRPVGLLFLVSLLFVLILWLYKNKKMLQFYLLSAVSIASVVVILNSPYTAFVNPDSIRRMEIICQVPEIKNPAEYKEYNREGLYKAFTVIKDEIGFGTFFKNGIKKLGYFFGMYRSYYSWQNNLLLICFTVFYPVALIGIFSKPERSFYYTRVFSMIYLSFTAVGIFFTCDEWSNRFISAAFPFILILAAGGISKAFKKNDSVVTVN